ncbi:MAG: hypothetical protein MJZ37_11215, partial [Bacilli bacterium]|nr:hypothetical protein [Bacilli bacterium]
YYVGRDTITWKFVSEYSTDTTFCDQFIFIQSDMKPLFDCDSLKNAPIDTVLSGICEISAEDLKVKTPFALDACTKDTIWGVGTRRSGNPVDGIYYVGRDTIDWKFESEYSTEVATCEQYVFIQNDDKPNVDCDSLKNAPIKKVLEGVCEITAEDLNVNIPFALTCFNDTIWGQGSRKSGASMTDKYLVGRDTIVWMFGNENTVDTAYCEQYVFIQSDLKPVFDCDSLKNDPIEKVLEGVCEISAEDLKVNTPFALDACTNDTIWGEGRRLSGASMTDKYVVGRDTIIWKFVSEYSTTVDSCEQYVFIQSDLKPVFDCDSLKNDPIEKVLEGVCEI